MPIAYTITALSHVARTGRDHPVVFDAMMTIMVLLMMRATVAWATVVQSVTIVVPMTSNITSV